MRIAVLGTLITATVVVFAAAQAPARHELRFEVASVKQQNPPTQISDVGGMVPRVLPGGV